MKSLNRRLVTWLSGAVLVGGSIVACQADCEEKLNCGPYEPDDGDAGSSSGGGPSGAGTSGSAGSAGSSASGGSGASGTAGMGEAGAGAATNAGDGGAAGGGGFAGDGGSGGGTGGCNEGRGPRLESCLIDERYSVFVSPDGDDRADGTRDAPVGTVGRAIAMAQASGRAVIACSGDYDETVTVSGAPGVRVHGGFDCENAWTPSARKSLLFPSEGAALRVEGTSNPVVFEDFAFQSADATVPGASSIAVFVVDASDVTLRRAAITAGKGADAVTPETPGFDFPDFTTLDGRDATAEGGGTADACECPGGVTNPRAKGGDSEENGTIGLPDYDGPGGEAGLTALTCGAAGSERGAGLDGAPGPAGSDASGATELGVLTSSSWTPKAGESAGAGLPGQGGGGGAGKPGGGGGSGGCGGCGGEGGPGGGGGGASIALASIDSKVTLEQVDVVTADAGDGADGGVGQPGQDIAGAGGAGFGSGSARGCFGGNGGPGGDGGRGGGGAGGISVGVLYRGDQPELDAVTIVFGSPGDGGLGADPNSDEDDGVDGKAQETLALP